MVLSLEYNLTKRQGGYGLDFNSSNFELGDYGGEHLDSCSDNTYSGQETQSSKKRTHAEAWDEEDQGTEKSRTRRRLNTTSLRAQRTENGRGPRPSPPHPCNESRADLGRAEQMASSRPPGGDNRKGLAPRPLLPNRARTHLEILQGTPFKDLGIL